MTVNAYLTIYFLALIFACFSINIRENYFFAFWLATTMTLSFLIREVDGDPEADIEKYIAIIMDSEWNWTPNYIREFIFWGYFRIINFIMPNRVLLMMGMDLTLFLLLYKSLNLIRIKYFIGIDSKSIRYMYFAILFFFPYYMGMHLHYRQIFACIVFVIALGCAKENTFTSLIILLVSLLIHNVVFIFIPMFFLLGRSIFIKFFGGILIFLMPFLLLIMEKSDNEYIMRHDINYAPTLATYFLIFFILQIFFIFCIEKFVLLNKRNSIILRILLPLLILYSISYIFLERSLSIERVGLFIFAIIYPFLIYYIDTIFLNKKFFRFLFINFSILPMFIFYSF